VSKLFPKNGASRSDRVEVVAPRRKPPASEANRRTRQHKTCLSFPQCPFGQTFAQKYGAPRPEREAVVASAANHLRATAIGLLKGGRGQGLDPGRKIPRPKQRFDVAVSLTTRHWLQEKTEPEAERGAEELKTQAGVRHKMASTPSRDWKRLA
jgi:hypothetical protein